MMNPVFDFLTVFILLAAEPTDGPVPQTCHPAVVAEVALQLEILDQRECGYFLKKEIEWSCDVNLLRRRWAALKDAPHADDALRLPERTHVNDLLSFNRNYRQNIDSRIAGESARSSELRQVLEETDRLYQVWDAVRDTRCEHYYITVRRLALKRLRELLGEENYYAGRLPPHVPLWRFQEVR